MNKNEFLKHWRKVKTIIMFIITSFFLSLNCSVYLLSAALYKLIFVLLKDALFHWQKGMLKLLHDFTMIKSVK
jgi:hypothetical protein